jgi:hypothetical protein
MRELAAGICTRGACSWVRGSLRVRDLLIMINLPGPSARAPSQSLRCGLWASWPPKVPRRMRMLARGQIARTLKGKRPRALLRGQRKGADDDGGGALRHPSLFHLALGGSAGYRRGRAGRWHLCLITARSVPSSVHTRKKICCRGAKRSSTATAARPVAIAEVRAPRARDNTHAYPREGRKWEDQAPRVRLRVAERAWHTERREHRSARLPGMGMVSLGTRCAVLGDRSRKSSGSRRTISASDAQDNCAAVGIN